MSNQLGAQKSESVNGIRSMELTLHRTSAACSRLAASAVDWDFYSVSAIKEGRGRDYRRFAGRAAESKSYRADIHYPAGSPGEI